MKIAQLQPGPAWNEAERRSIPIGIIGFFLVGLVAKFGDLAEPFPLGLSGAVGFFLAALALMLGFYHRKAFTAQFVAGGLLVLPFALTALGVRLLPLTRGRSIVVLVGGLVSYLALHLWHRTLSKVESGTYVRQLAGDDNLVPWLSQRLLSQLLQSRVQESASQLVVSDGTTALLGPEQGVVLGKFPQYVDTAEALGANAFNINENLYGFLNNFGQSWTANQAFIDASVFRGQQFFLSTVGASGSYAMELEYLQSIGIGPESWQGAFLPFY